TAKTLAIYNEGNFDPNVSYSLKDTPCGEVVGNHICCYPQEVRSLFPDDTALEDIKAESYIGTTLWSFNGQPIGLIAVIGQKPLQNQELAASVLKLVSLRAAGKLEATLADEKVRESEEKFRVLIQSTSVGIYLTDLNGKCTYVNPKWCEMAQLSYNQALDDGWVNGIYEEDREKVFENWQKMIASYGNWGFEYRFGNPGNISWVYGTAKSYKNESGEIVGYIGSNVDITERKQSEAIIRDIIEKNPMSIQILDMEGYPIQVNPAHTKLFGAQPPSDYSVLKDPQLLSQGFGELFEQIKKGEVVYFPSSYYNVNDVDPTFPYSPVWVRAVGFTLNDNYGRPEKIVLMHENVTERKHAETSFIDIVEKNPMSIQIVDIEGYTLHGNPEYIKLFGSIPPPHFSIFDDLSGKSPELEKLVLLAKSGEVVHLPDIYFNAHDSVPEAPDIPLWIRALIFPLKDSGGKPERFVFMHENITERKKAEQELIAAKQIAEESEVKYRQIFDNTFDIMAIYEVTEDRRYKVVTFNAAEAKLIGPVENYQNRYIDECIPPDLYDQFRRNYERCIEAGELIVYEEDISFGAIHKTFHTQLIPLKNSEGRIHRIIVISRDITENKLLHTQLIEQNKKLRRLNIDLKDAKEKAEESDKLKSAFLANMSHEIRTPMNGILGFAELLEDDDLTSEKQQEYVKIIRKSGARMLNIINDIIDISKIESGQMKVDNHETNVNELLEFVVDFFKPEVEAKGMQIILGNTLSERESIIMSDREKVYAVLTNLVKNAIKFTKDGSIELGYEKVDDYLRFFIKDTGIGIHPHLLKIVFERFRQGSELSTRNYEGSGLGLSISKAYVEMLGGQMWVESKVGVGSVFYFTLPYAIRSKKRDVHSPVGLSEFEESPIRKLKILIAEDDTISELFLNATIKKYSKEILNCKTGTEAVQICINNPDIDLIFMDVRMPEMDGYEATALIRQFNKEVIIVAQTAFVQSGIRETALKAGCNDYVSKPIAKRKLIEILHKYFEN
ncbi:MAG: PAS domain S-box protein, partial [Prolixibacteraceae bacterium]|nr:PAS domain S-box protein [Prolixibacteraceae bacterium]